jgi:gliding motility-associated-like protein
MTPNEDGYNDTFIIPCLANYSLSKVCIFNRWGDQVYQSDNYQNDWRGTNQSNDEALPSGTYFYVLEVNDGENTVLTGYIFIER